MDASASERVPLVFILIVFYFKYSAYHFTSALESVMYIKSR